MYGREIAGRTWFLRFDSLNQHVRDNEKVAASQHQFHHT
jgi:hypothetical protein